MNIQKLFTVNFRYMFVLILIGFNINIKAQVEPRSVVDYYSSIEFDYHTVEGIGHEKGVTRRDPSDVIKVGDIYYVYYTKVFGRSPGYWGTLWYATSTDKGHTWKEEGEILAAGKAGAFDSQATFTPNIIYANGYYYLYYTGVKPTPGNEDNEFENNHTTDITAIGVAVSKLPGGPFERTGKGPVLTVSIEPEKFDSYRVDDASLLFRNGLFWLYYKGRSRTHGKTGPRHTKMGVAYSKSPEGPFIKFDRPLLEDSHEVIIWPESMGVAVLASISSTIEYAADGVDFKSNQARVSVENRPNAPGAYRPDLVQPVVKGERLSWGISMVHNESESYLIRFEVRSK